MKEYLARKARLKRCPRVNAAREKERWGGGDKNNNNFLNEPCRTSGTFECPRATVAAAQKTKTTLQWAKSRAKGENRRERAILLPPPAPASWRRDNSSRRGILWHAHALLPDYAITTIATDYNGLKPFFYFFLFFLFFHHTRACQRQRSLTRFSNFFRFHLAYAVLLLSQSTIYGLPSGLNIGLSPFIRKLKEIVKIEF